MRQRVRATFAAILRREREAAALSQEALAHKAGLHRTYVGMIERGERKPTVEVAANLAKVLGQRLSDWAREWEG